MSAAPPKGTAVPAGGDPPPPPANAPIPAGLPAGNDAPTSPSIPRLPIFERFLPIWVLLCMVIGTVIGAKAPAVAAALARAQVGGINVIVSILVWLMIAPMLLAVDLAALKRAAATPGPILLTSATNYAIQPALMFGAATLAFRVIFSRFISPTDQAQFIAGCVLLGCAPCTAMVLVWSHLVGGDTGYTIVQVAVNDALLLVLYVPLAGLFIGAASLPPPYATVAISVALFLVAPLLVATVTRLAVLRWRGPAALAKLRAALAPAMGAGLLATLLLVFTFQGAAIVVRPTAILMIVAPLAVQTFGVWGFVYMVGGRLCGLRHALLAPASLIATSNFFELAVATAAAVYGPGSGAALATTVGVLVEVPLMLALVWCCNRLKPGVETRAAVRAASGGWRGWVSRACNGGRRGVGGGGGEEPKVMAPPGPAPAGGGGAGAV
jgi:ACR3 family arsenite transporter